jgi:hypothetical protein
MENEALISGQDLIEGLKSATDALAQHRVQYAVIGGMAATFRSQPRFTKDLDFLLTVPQIGLPGLLETLKSKGFQFDLLDTIREWTQHHMAVLSYRGIRVDWLKPVLSAYQHVLDTATDERWLNQSIRVASTEGLILLKLLAFRTQDLLDIENLIAARGPLLDVNWIRSEWQTLASADDPRLARLMELVSTR